MKLMLIVFWMIAAAMAALVGPLPPTEDPFYQLPPGFEQAKPGDILKSRPTPAPIRSVLLPAKVKSATQYLVRSTDQHGNPTAFVTTLIKPFNGDLSKLVSFQTATDSSDPNCAPSYSILVGADITTIETQVEFLQVQLLLDKGYNVVWPDYQGPTSAYIMAKMGAYATLDSIRAVLNQTLGSGIDADARTVLWGYSGGSQPSLWALALLEEYAPDLKDIVVGATFGGTIADIKAVAKKIDGTVYAGFLVQAVAGILKTYPELSDFFNQELSTQKLTFLNQAYNLCMFPTLVVYGLQRVFSAPFQWAKDGWAVFDNPLVKTVVDENTLANLVNPQVPKIPIFMYHGTNDDVIPFTENSERIYNLWCPQGANIDFAVDLTGIHVTTAVTSLPAAYKFIDDRLQNRPFQTGCRRRNWLSNALIPGTDPTIIPLVVSTLSLWLGVPIGPLLDNPGLADRQTIIQKLGGLVGAPNPTSVPGYSPPATA